MDCRNNKIIFKKMKHIIFLILTLILVSCASEEVKQLKSVEVREYEGEKLDSFTDLQDVSI